MQQLEGKSAGLGYNATVSYPYVIPLGDKKQCKHCKTSNLQLCSNAFVELYRFHVTTSREIVQLIFATTPSSPFLIWDKDLTGAAANMGIFSLLHGDQRTLIPTGEKLLRNPLSHPINTKR